jgi:hypothetical protein
MTASPKSGQYWVRIKGYHNGQWTVAVFRNNLWYHCKQPIDASAVLQIGDFIPALDPSVMA